MVQGNTSMATVHNGQSPGGAGGWDLVTAAQQGDREAFGRLYGQYVGGVSRFLNHRLQDRGLVEDLTSETFTRALRRIDSVSDQGRDVAAWFTTIARNLVFDHAKSHRTQRETSVAEVADADTAQPGPEQVAICNESAAEVRRHVAQLPPDQQECLRLRFWQGLSGAETASAMGRSEDAIKALRHRAIVGLRASLTRDTTAPAPTRETADPLASARRAVAEVAVRVAGEQRRGADLQGRVQQLARWQADDQAGQVDQRGAGGVVALAEGVA
jgi:RNA polymerase sigma-70 factor (ECF subfamily)